MEQMLEVMKETPKLKGSARRRTEAALSRILRHPEPLDVPEARTRFDTVLARVASGEARADPTEFQVASQVTA
jgi:beta-N-acetylhexosaminidase